MKKLVSGRLVDVPDGPADRTVADERRIARNVIRMLADREGPEQALTRAEIDAWTDAAISWTFGFSGEEKFSDSELITAAVSRLESESISIEFWRENGA